MLHPLLTVPVADPGAGVASPRPTYVTTKVLIPSQQLDMIMLML